MPKNKSKNQIDELWISQKWKPIYLDGKLSEYLIGDQGYIWSKYINRVMKPSPNSDGYLTTVLTMDGKRYTVAIHRLVAIAFIPNPLNLPEVNHINGNKLKNDTSNLEWTTHQDNMIHANKTGLRSKIIGSDNPNNKYSPELIHQVCQLLSNWWSVRDIEKELGVPKNIIKNIICGKSWTSIRFRYPLPEHLRVNVVSQDGSIVSEDDLAESIGLLQITPPGYRVHIQFQTSQKYRVQRSSLGSTSGLMGSIGVRPQANGGG